MQAEMRGADDPEADARPRELVELLLLSRQHHHVGRGHARGQRRGRALEKEELGVRVRPDRDEARQVDVDSEHRPDVRPVHAHVGGRAARRHVDGPRPEAPDEGVAAANPEIRIDAPDPDVKRRLRVELPEVERRELQIAGAHAQREEEQAHAGADPERAARARGPIDGQVARAQRLHVRVGEAGVRVQIDPLEPESAVLTLVGGSILRRRGVAHRRRRLEVLRGSAPGAEPHDRAGGDSEPADHASSPAGRRSSPSASSASSDVGTAYRPSSHLPRSTSLHRGEQNGADLFCERGGAALRQIGQGAITPKHNPKRPRRPPAESSQKWTPRWAMPTRPAPMLEPESA